MDELLFLDVVGAVPRADLPSEAPHVEPFEATKGRSFLKI